MSSTLPPTAAPQGTPNSGAGNKSDNTTIALALILVGVMVLLLLVAVNDDNEQTLEVSGGDTTATTQASTTDTTGSGGSGDSGGSGGSGGELPGEYQYTLTAAAGTVQYGGSCNVVEGMLTASGAGAQGESIVLSVDVVAQDGSAQVAALGTEFEGTINTATVGDGTFEVAGVGSEADDSATGSAPFSVAGGCNTGSTNVTPTPSPTPSVEPAIHDFTATIPEGTASLQGPCVVVDGQLTVNGTGESGESLSVNANVNDQTGTMTISAAGANYEGTVNAVVIGDGTFEVRGTAVPSDDSATGEVEISASGGCTT